MPKYNVHAYVLVRVKVGAGVTAKSPAHAARKVVDDANMGIAFHSGEYADEITEFMVDRLDKNYMVVATHNLDGNYKRLRNRG